MCWIFLNKKNITKFRSSDLLTDVGLYFILMGQTRCERGHIGAIKTAFFALNNIGMFKQMSCRLVENPKIRDIFKYFLIVIFDFFSGDFVMYIEGL